MCGEMSSELFKEREAQRELRQTRQTFATLHHSKEMSDMCYELSKEHAAQRELSQKLDALHRVKEMTDLALQSERHEHERTRARLDAVERVVLQANELANQLDRERQMHEATALDLANVLARERSVHDTMRQQLSQQQLDLQSAETQAARESTTQQRQLSERLGTCEAALARRDERIAPPGRWPRITTPTGRHAHGSSAFEIECVETPSVCACAPTVACGQHANRRRYCIHLMSPSTLTPKLSSSRQGMGSVATPALARRLAQSNIQKGVGVAPHGMRPTAAVTRAPFSALRWRAVPLYTLDVSVSLMIVPLSQQAHASCGHAPFLARESTALRSLRQDVDKSISHHSRSHSRGGRDDHR